MKRKLLSLIVWLAPLGLLAQGWPENYDGVMLQGFYWDSYEDAKWTTLTLQADELSSYFKLIWVPNSGQTKEDKWNSPGNWGYENMGYMPVYWLRHNTCFGTQEELMQMISTFKAKGTGFIEDVVINHKNGLTNWADFPNETVTGPTTGKTYTVTWATDMSNLWGICSGDELFSLNGGLHDDVQYTCASSAGADEGDNFDGCRDLDHTNGQVQENIYNYLDYLLDELGYVGFRYDMVKGYRGYYTGLYNMHAKPEFSVGEYWDSSFDNVVYDWIKETGRPANWTPQSAAFDFPLKYVMNDVFDNGNWSALSNKGIAGSPDWNRYAVTFVDNHDTYRNDGDRVDNNVLAANAFILAMPGTPCVFLPHWKQYKPEIKKMIAARKAAGITNQSPITEQYIVDNGAGYYLKVTGTKGSVILTLGNLLGRTVDTTDHTLVLSGDNFALYVWDGIYNSDTFDAIDEESAKDITVYVKQTDAGAPNIYAWNGGKLLNGGFPGTQITETATLADGTTWYKKTFHTNTFNVIVSYNGSNMKSDDIMGVTDDIYLCYYKGDNKKHADYTPLYKGDATASTIHAYFDAPSGWDKAWAWNTKFYDVENKNYTGGNWPGQTMQKVGTSSSGNDIYRWGITKNFNEGVPNSIIFSGNDGQTATLGFINAAYYDQSGVASGDCLYFHPQALANAVLQTGTNWDGNSGTVAENNGSTPMTQNIYFPAGDYTVQAIVRGTNGGQATLSVGQAGNEATTASVALTGLDNAVSTVTTSGLVEEVETGTNNGWHKVQAHCVMDKDDVLKVTLSSDATTWQVGAITFLRNADTQNHYRTTATTDVTQTNADITNMEHFCFYGRGANKNALVTATSGQEPASLPCNVIVNRQCAKLALTDGRYDFLAPESFSASAISYNREFEKDKKATVCLPFAITKEEMQELRITAYDFDKISSSTIHFSLAESMEANHPYVVEVETSGTPFASLSGRQVAETGDLGIDISGAIFKGTMQRTILSSDDNNVYYGYSNGSFVRVGSNVGVNPFRAYIKSGTDLGAAVEAVFDEGADDIREVQGRSCYKADVYTIDGRKVETTNNTTLPKGMYVSKGRKFVVK